VVASDGLSQRILRDRIFKFKIRKEGLTLIGDRRGLKFWCQAPFEGKLKFWCLTPFEGLCQGDRESDGSDPRQLTFQAAGLPLLRHQGEEGGTASADHHP